MVGGEKAKLISMDVASDVLPEDSKHPYSAEERAFYSEVKKAFEAYRRKHPDAILDVRE